jgi:hypothetical protein
VCEISAHFGSGLDRIALASAWELEWKHGIALAWGELATAGKSTIIRREVNDAA